MNIWQGNYELYESFLVYPAFWKCTDKSLKLCTCCICISTVLNVQQAIYIIMGANIGTSVTNTIVSLAQVGKKNEFRRAFGAATVHDMFNWLGVLILLPVEVFTGYLYRTTSVILKSMNVKSNEEVKIELLKKLTKPLTSRIIQVRADCFILWCESCLYMHTCIVRYYHQTLENPSSCFP